MTIKNPWPIYYKKDVITHYCPGCGHGIVHRIVAEVLEELDVGRRAICVNPAGCAVLAYQYFDIDMLESAHGRGTAMATGIKRSRPDLFVFTYQGDGDLSAIGTAETIHSANRGEQICVIFINNAVYGMTGGQMAPTTLIDMKTTTTPKGRTARVDGFPLHITDVVATFPGVAYAERVAVNGPAGINRTKKAITTAFQTQIDGLGYSIIEVLSPCPTNWKLNSIDSFAWITDVMAKEFPIGVLVDRRRKQADAD
ncbi:MAG TPA: thiamine pyrophosphate-dependent enzyme [Spirochaetota bacterium]|nr:thiamine pyrophosphate-dependent enzyme [Spirochaetota bacterium]HOS41690.1 thiamine pyrophosphate-dependent enzyme [Spirochaetota bacterium]HPI23772.1 thiamine pyrophosphate-dependent enzyme [Spirochaetota bacterium]